MKKKTYIIALFLILALVQTAAPFSMIVRREIVLSKGTQYRFKTEPVDPYDAFRGRYVALRIKEADANIPRDLELQYGQTVYVVINNDSEGFAKISEIKAKRPKDGNYIKTKVRYFYKDKVRLKMPFDRFYMEEKSAPKAEKVYWKHSRREKNDAYIVVRVRSGLAVAEDLYVGNKPIAEFIKTTK